MHYSGNKTYPLEFQKDKQVPNAKPGIHVSRTVKQEKFWNAISDLKIKIINLYVLSNLNLQVILHLIKTRGRLLRITF